MQLSPGAARLHAFLFLEGGSMSLRRLTELAQLAPGEAQAAIDELARALQGSGLTLIATGEQVTLATAPEVSEAIKRAFEAQLQRDIGDAGLEVVSIILYRGPSTRAE